MIREMNIGTLIAVCYKQYHLTNTSWKNARCTFKCPTVEGDIAFSMDGAGRVINISNMTRGWVIRKVEQVDRTVFYETMGFFTNAEDDVAMIMVSMEYDPISINLKHISRCDTKVAMINFK